MIKYESTWTSQPAFPSAVCMVHAVLWVCLSKASVARTLSWAPRPLFSLRSKLLPLLLPCLFTGGQPTKQGPDVSAWVLSTGFAQWLGYMGYGCCLFSSAASSWVKGLIFKCFHWRFGVFLFQASCKAKATAQHSLRCTFCRLLFKGTQPVHCLCTKSCSKGWWAMLDPRVERILGSSVRGKETNLSVGELSAWLSCNLFV